MSNSVMDPDSDQKNAPVQDDTLYNDRPMDGSLENPDPKDRGAVGEPIPGVDDPFDRDGNELGGGSSSGTKKGGGLFNRGRDTKADSPSELGKKEASSGSGGLFNSSNKEGSGPFGRARAGASNLKGKLSKLGKNKWLVGLGAGSAAGMVCLIVLLVVLLGALKIPNLTEHITTYQFNRIGREYAKNIQRTTAEKIAIEAADDTAYSKIKARYANLREGTWGKLDNYRPAIVTKNLGVKDGMKFNYERSGILGRERLKGITIGNESFPVKRVTGPARFVPGLKNVLQFKNELELSKTVMPAIDETMQSRNVGRLVRGVVANNLRKEANIGLIAWAASGKAFGGKTAREADLALLRDSYKVINYDSDNPKLVTKSLQATSDEVKEQVPKTLASDADAGELIDNGGVDPKVKGILDKSFSKTVMDTVSGILNPIGAVALPACIIYDGSLEKAGPTIDSQTQSEQKAYYYLSSASSQQKAGRTTPEAVGAMNRKVGDNISSSNPEVRANGGTANTSNTLSAEASATGQVTVLDALLPSEAAGAINAVADKTCPVVLSTEFLVASTIAQIALAIVSGGTSTEASASLEVSSEGFLTVLQKSMVARFAATKATLATGKREAAGKAASTVLDTGTSVVRTTVVIAGATVASKLIVMAHANSLHNGTEQNDDFINEADSGGNFTAQQLDQKQNYGRPMTTAETQKADKESKDSLAQINREKSTYQRYADINNADSLINKVAIMSSAYIKPSFLATLVSSAKNVLNPLQNSANWLGGLHMQPAFADSNVDSNNYGNVQFGWTDDEEALIDSSATYQPLENQYILETYGDKDAIEAKFGPCYTRTIGVLLSGSESDNKPDIVRDQNANVLDEGLCKKSNLSYNGTDPLSVDSSPDSPAPNDMVFRWRLSHRYDAGLNQLNADMTITKSDQDGAPDVSLTDLPTGTAQELAQALLKNKNVTYEGNSGTDMQLAAQGKPGTAGAPLSQTLLAILTALATKHKFNVSAFESYGTNHSEGSAHYTGHAVDITQMDGDPIADSGIGRTKADKKAIIDIAPLLPKGSGFGQSNCGSTPPLPSGIDTFEDACSHLHLELPASAK